LFVCLLASFVFAFDFALVFVPLPLPSTLLSVCFRRLVVGKQLKLMRSGGCSKCNLQLGRCSIMT